MEIRILHVDDRDIIRAGIRSLLADSFLHLVGAASSGGEAVRLAEERSPDILLFNIQTSGFDGVQFLRTYRRQFPRQKVIVLAPSNDPYYLYQAAEMGVRDYVLDGIRGLDLIRLCQNIYYGTGESSNPAWSKTLEMFASHSPQKAEQKLTHREENVLRFLVMGMSNKEIAAQLNLSPETVKEHLKHIFRKIGAHDRTEAAVWAVRKGLA